MDLKERKFYFSGHELRFVTFSDHPCRVRYLESIPLPMGQTPVDVYTIEPAADSQWVVVEEKDDQICRLRFFVRRGERFCEDNRQQVSESVRKQLQLRLPRTKRAHHCFRAA